MPGGVIFIADHIRKGWSNIGENYLSPLIYICKYKICAICG